MNPCDGNCVFCYDNRPRRGRIKAVDVWELNQQGLTTKQIAERLGVYPATISHVCREAGIIPNRPPVKGRWSDERIVQAGRLLDEGASYEEVARTMGADAKTVRKYHPGRGFTQEQITEMATIGRKYRHVMTLEG